MSVKVSNNQDPYIINKNLGAPLQIDADDLPGKNADGQAVIELTVEQKYAFDTRGWLLIPEVLGGSELEEMQDFCHRLHHDPSFFYRAMFTIMMLFPVKPIVRIRVLSGN